MASIEVGPEDVEALELARAQVLVRIGQLSHCRVCGADLQRFERARGVLQRIIEQAEAPPNETDS